MGSEVVIIGAGPAGCYAALACKQFGLRAVVVSGSKITMQAQPAAAVPSESIHPGVASVLALVHAEHCIAAASTGIYQGIETGSQYNALGADDGGPWHGHHINRALFDAALLATVLQNGIQVIGNDAAAAILSKDQRVSGIITESGLQLECRFVIDASGSQRFGGKKMGFTETFYSPPLVSWTGLSTGLTHNNTGLHENRTKFIPEANGWTWLAPEPGNKCTWTRLALKGRQKFDPPPVLQGYPLASPIKKSNRRWRVFRPVCTEGLLLCGDAAGILDPAAGQGILNALISASKAVGTVNACITNPDFEALYLAKYDEWFFNNYVEKVGLLRYFYQQHKIEKLG